MFQKTTKKRLFLSVIIVFITVIAVARLATGKTSWLTRLDSDPAVPIAEENRQPTSDNPWNELEKVYAVLHNNGYVFYAGNVRLTDESEEVTIENANFSCRYAGKNFRHVIDSVEIIKEDDLVLNVYHREKLLVAGHEYVPANTLWAYMSADSLKRFASQQGATANVYADGNNKVVVLENPNGEEVVAYEITYHPTDYKVVKVMLSLATLSNLGEVASVQGEDELQTVPVEGSENSGGPAAVEEDQGPTFGFHVYKLTFTYEQIRPLDKAENFHPVNQYVMVSKKGLQVAPAYKDYRGVWIGEGKR